MKATLACFGFAVLLTTGACHRNTPVAASHPADTTPVAPPPSSMPAQPRSSGPAASPSQRVAETPRSTEMPKEVREALNERLARLEDAMFDYDKATIRSDASTALKDD